MPEEQIFVDPERQNFYTKNPFTGEPEPGQTPEKSLLKVPQKMSKKP